MRKQANGSRLKQKSVADSVVMGLTHGRSSDFEQRLSFKRCSVTKEQQRRLSLM